MGLFWREVGTLVGVWGEDYMCSIGKYSRRNSIKEKLKKINKDISLQSLNWHWKKIVCDL